MVLGRITSLGTGKLVVLALLGVGVTIGGAFAVGVIGAPSVVGVDNGFGDVTEGTTEIETNLTVNNPNPLGVRLGGLTIDYEVLLNDVSMAQGVREGVPLESGNSTVAFTTEMSNEKIPAWWVSHLRNDEHTTLSVNADVHSSLLNRSFEAPAVERSINTSLISAFNSDEEREVNADTTGVEDPVLIVRETRGEWGSVSEETTEVRMAFDVYNPREYPVAISNVGYDVAMNNVSMGGGETNDSVVIPPGGTETLEVTFELTNENLDEWWVSHLQNDQVTTLTADFYLRVDLSDVGAGTTEVPLDTMEQTIETDIFGEGGGDGTNGGTDGGTSDDESTTGESTDDGTTETEGDASTETATPTETETETESGTTETETDDGGGLLDDLDASDAAAAGA
ncbi:LEA type 2 family protein [Haloparvum sedimenti]|uniref:LEA type 2 family protein n=1 Tax=Haloparvum sedimenti TaxID=1678448 RepID=UPI00071E8423|nr:LEA type 2 family protein [Haloparvum sedimenti]